MLGLSLFICLVVSWFEFRKFAGLFKISLMVLGTISIAVMGARLFHVIFEKPDFFMEHPELILTRLDGMTFYGAFLAGLLPIWGFAKYFAKSEDDGVKILSVATILASLVYGIMRIGCFAVGCCWGKACPLPWSVVYRNSDSLMPFIGIPVHPVQLYDSIFGFSLAVVLTWLYRRSHFHRRAVFPVFLILYPVGRFFTETFRGDSYRGTDVVFSMSTSQAISFVLFFVGIYQVAKLMMSKEKGHAWNEQNLAR